MKAIPYSQRTLKAILKFLSTAHEPKRVRQINTVLNFREEAVTYMLKDMVARGWITKPGRIRVQGQEGQPPFTFSITEAGKTKLKELEDSPPPLPKRCIECGASATYLSEVTWEMKGGEVKSIVTPHWYGSKANPICGRCYARGNYRKEHVLPRDIKCVRCGSEKTLLNQFGYPCWCKNPTGEEYICWSCNSTIIDTGRVPSKDTRAKIGLKHKGKIRTLEDRQKQSKSISGEKNHFFKKTHSEKTRKILSERMSGENNPFYGKKRPEHSKAMSKENNPRWKGGITPLVNQIRTCPHYIDWRRAVFERDGYTCQICHDDGGHNLQAHHIEPFSLILATYGINSLEAAIRCPELWDVTNGITYCDTCHKIIEGQEL
jgi:5-methylcytosine-specific restriction endonuclease McrA